MYVLNILIHKLPIDKRLGQEGVINAERRIVISVGSVDGLSVIGVIDQIHNVFEFFAWFSGLLSELLVKSDAPRFLNDSGALAESIDNFYQHATDVEIEKFGDELFDYRKVHDFRFGFRGTNVPSILLGRWHDSITISSVCEKGFNFKLNPDALVVSYIFNTDLSGEELMKTF